MNTESFDTKDLAARLASPVTKPVEKAAYNFLVFLREMGFAEATGGTRKAPGKEKSKGTTLYRLLPTTPATLWHYITGKHP